MNVPLLATMIGALLLWSGAWLADEVAPPGVPPTVEAPARSVATVDRVIDGSSLDTHIAGIRTAVGYLGAQTPASNQSCGAEALARNRELAGREVLLEEDPAYQFDEYGRRLYYAFLPDGQSIDETLVREGLARAVRTDASHGAALAGAEAEAQAAGRGCLWGGG